MELKLDFDQSVFVRAAVNNVVREAVISSILVSLMILLFLGDWRSTVIVSLSIPLSIWRGHHRPVADGPEHQSDDFGRAWRWRSACWWITPPSLIENIHRNQTLGKGLTLRDPGRVGRGHPAADRGDARHLHRLLSGGAAGRPGALPVHSARHHRGAGDAGVLYPVLHRGAGLLPLHPDRPCASGRRGPGPVRRVRARLRPAARCLWPRALDVVLDAAQLRPALRRPAAGADRRRCSSRSSAPISSPPPMSASSSCIIAPRPAPASRRPKGRCWRWKARSARSSRRPSCTPSTT